MKFNRLFAQRYAAGYSEPVPIEQLVHHICDQKQGYTQFGGLRPFGVSFLFAGWYCFFFTLLTCLDFLCYRDKSSGFQLYQSDPSGNYAGWTVRSTSFILFLPSSSKMRMYFWFDITSALLLLFPLLLATAIGANNQAAQAILKSEYAPSMSLNAARKLALKVLKQTMDSTILMPEKVEMCEVARAHEVPSEQHIRFRMASDKELEELCGLANSATLPTSWNLLHVAVLGQGICHYNPGTRALLFISSFLF